MKKILRQIWIYKSDLDDLKNIIDPLYKEKSGKNKHENTSNAILFNECLQTIIDNKEWLK